MAEYKIDWQPTDFINFDDWNRIENNVLELNSYIQSLSYPLPDMRVNRSALRFNGVDNYVNIGTWVQAALTNAFTIECWVKVKGGTGLTQTIMSNFDAGGFGFQYDVPTAPKRFSAMANIAGTYQTTWSWTDVEFDRWYHLAYSYNGSQFNFYVDGNNEGTINVSGNVAAPTTGAPFVLGGNPNGTAPNPTEWLNGCVDDVRIWNYGRSQANIQANMHKHLIGTEVGLVAYWECNEAAGTTLVARTGVNGTIVGATWTTDVPSVGIVNNRDVKTIDYLSTINRIEDNIEFIRANTFTPYAYLGKKTWIKKMGFSHEDANRLENNIKQLRDTGTLVFQSFKYAGTFTSGQEGGLF